MKYANENNKYFTKSEALEEIKVFLEEGYEEYYADLHHHTFNMDYYIDESNSEEALEEYGVFKAIKVIRDYEMENFGEVYTDISDPFKVANALWYIIGEEVIAELESVSKRWDEEASEEGNEAIIAEINAMLE